MDFNYIFSSYLLIFCAFLKAVTNAQDPVPDPMPSSERFVFSPLAISSMIKGLLDMQIRPQGGHYEEKYKKIFGDGELPIERVFVNSYDMHVPEYKGEPLSDDGKLLKESMEGNGPNPCFEMERIERNPLLGLLCSLQMQKGLNEKPKSVN